MPKGIGWSHRRGYSQCQHINLDDFVAAAIDTYDGYGSSAQARVSAQ